MSAPRHLTATTKALAISGAIGILLWPRIVWMVGLWAHRDLYSFCFFIAPISGFLAWKRRRRLREGGVRGSAYGLLVLAAGVGLTIFLDVSPTKLNSLTPLLIVVILAGITWSLGGFGTVRTLAFPLLFLLLLMPVPLHVVTAIDYPLQEFCAIFTTHAAHWVGIPALWRGATVFLPTFTMGIAPECNGLRSSFAMVALGALLAYIRKGPWPRKVAVATLAVPLAYCANFFRLFCDVVVVNSLGSRFHLYERAWDLSWGFLTFIIAAAFLLVIAKLLGCGEYRTIS